MGIVLPHGVLFRGGAEGTIRETLLRNGNIYAVIGLPSGIFFSTGIPTCVVILKKNNTDRSVFFVDASKEFRKEGPRNYLDPEHINKIVEAVLKRENVEKFAHLATFEEIQSNDFNLNIPRYVDNSEEEAEIDISTIFAELEKLDTQEVAIDKKLDKFLSELGINKI